MECSKIIERAVDTLKLGFKCVEYDKRTCIVTPYLYPDNDLIEVFAEDIGGNHVRITDLGETLRHLESTGLDLLASRKRRFLLEQITKRLHVEIQRGKLQKEGPIDSVGDLLVDVAAAAQAVADLIYTSKAYEPATFPEEVSIFLTEHNIEHERNYRVIGETGKTYRVNLRLDGHREKEILIEALSPSQETAMTATVNRVFRLWSDVDEGKRKVSLLNDVDYSWKKEDLVLLQKVSIIHNWTSKEPFLNEVRG
ncbi:DUF1828 domain-containing protein [Candidatus Omnitrophota bacterium]